MKAMVRRVLTHFGYRLVREDAGAAFPPDMDQEAVDIIRRVQPFTMTSKERVFALVQAVRYLIEAGVPGAFVECGVWRGGSMMAVAQVLLRLGCADRELHLFDTFEGMPQPTHLDVDYAGVAAMTEFVRTRRGTDASDWCSAAVDDVRRNLLSTGYGEKQMKFIQGRVENTVPACAPDSIALLRLDTDWYESTLHEMVHLFPRLSPGGVLIIDDYGYWQGARRAVDEYFAKQRIAILLDRVDNTGRIAVKRF